MAADATLVNMAYRAAMANVPGDWSQSFNKQYEGLIAAHQARADFGAAVVKGVADVGIGIKQTQAESIKGKGVAMDISHIYNNLGNTTAQEGIKAQQQHYENGGGSNPGEGDAAQQSMQVIGDQLEQYSTDIYMSKDDKYNQAGLYRAAEMQKGEIIQDKAKKREVVDAYANNMVNLELTYGGDGEKSLLLKQILDPKADWGKLGIRAAWEGGKKYYYYSGGRLKAEYDASRPPRREGDDYVSTDVSRSPLVNPPGYEPTDTEIRVSAEELYAGIEYKHLDVETNNKDIFIASKDPENVKQYKTFKGEPGAAYSLEEITKDGFKQNFMDAKGGAKGAIADFASRGLYGRVYGEALKEGITNSTYEMFLGAEFQDVLDKIDSNNDGKISSSESNKAIEGNLLHKNDVDALYQMLTSPKDDYETKFAVEEASNYLTNLAGQEFARVKAEEVEKNKVKTTTGKENKSDYEPPYMRDSRINSGFIDVGLKSFKLDDLQAITTPGYEIIKEDDKIGIRRIHDGTWMDTLDPNNPTKSRNILYKYAETRTEHKRFPKTTKSKVAPILNDKQKAADEQTYLQNMAGYLNTKK